MAERAKSWLERLVDVESAAQRMQKRCARHGDLVYLDPTSGRLFCSRGGEWVKEEQCRR